MAISFDPERLLTRRQGAEALKEAGFPTAYATLATLASRPGRAGSPIYRRYGRRVLYRWGDLLDWARSQLSQPIRNTSEADGP